MRKGFIFTIDAIIASAAIISLLAVYSISIHNYENGIKELETIAVDKATLKFYASDKTWEGLNDNIGACNKSYYYENKTLKEVQSCVYE